MYLDTNILIYALYRNDKPRVTSEAQKILRKIRMGVYKGVISTSVLMELISSLRKIIYDNPKNEKSSIDETKDAIEIILVKILQIPNLILYESGKRFSEVEKEALALIKTYTGKIWGDKYKFIHPLDAIHILLAKEAKCNAFCTTDLAFEPLKSEIHIIIIKEYS